MSEIVFSARAYCKIILHATKYPHSAVNGVLLAKTTKSKNIEFVDAVPLFHIALNLIPMAEIALLQIDQVAAQQGLFIAGYYTAHENLRENSFEKAYHRISEKLADNFPSACVVVVDNRGLGENLDNVALKVAQYSEGKYRPVEMTRISTNPDHTLDVCSRLLAMKMYNSIIDFDNHLDDVALDWLNGHINHEIEENL